MKIDTQWLVGFVDGEGYFSIEVTKNLTLIEDQEEQVIPEFRIVQHNRDVKLLYAIKKFFNCGRVISIKGSNTKNQIMAYRVCDLNHLFTIIIPFFKRYSLVTYKKFDFYDFASIIELMIKKVMNFIV